MNISKQFTAANDMISIGNGDEGRQSSYLRPIILALVYATFLALLPVDAFRDRYNYLVYAVSSDSILLNYEISGWTSVLSNEPIWLLLNIWLGRLFVPENCVRVFIFFSSFLLSFTILKNNKSNLLILILFLISPIVIKNYIIHLRQGVAIALFTAGYFSDRRWIGWILMGITPFVHSSFFIVCLALGIALATDKIRLPPYYRIALFFVIYLAFSLFLDAISAGLDARQAGDIQDVDIGGSGFAFIFWFAILAVFLKAGRSFVVANSFPISIVIFYLSSYFITPVSGRIFESGILIVMLSGLSLDKVNRKIYIFLMTAFILLSYASRINLPLLGWGE